MFRHFAMDPPSARIMRETAPAVFEWVARVWNARFRTTGGELLQGVPEDWGPILDSVGSAYLPYLCANAEAWKAGEGRFDVDIEGAPYRDIRTARYRVWCLEELRRQVEELSEADQREAQTRLEAHGCWEPLWRVADLASGLDPKREAPFAGSDSATGMTPPQAQKMWWIPHAPDPAVGPDPGSGESPRSRDAARQCAREVESKMSRWVWGGAGVLLVVLVGGWIVFDRTSLGIPGFMLWRATSGAAHGGQAIDVDTDAGARLYFETYGEGEPLLLIHGGLSTIETMHNQIRAFAGDRFVIAADSRAHGRSSPIEGGLHYADMADDMVALLDHLDVERADVFGWSDGGVIALDMAMRHPDRVGNIAVFGSNYHHEGLIVSEESPLDEGPDAESVAPLRFLYESVAADPALWPTFHEKTMTMWSTEPEYSEADLRAIRAPTLVMAGEHDMIEPEHLRALADAIPRGELWILPGGDHFSPMGDAEAVNARLAEFFAR